MNPQDSSDEITAFIDYPLASNSLAYGSIEDDSSNRLHRRVRTRNSVACNYCRKYKLRCNPVLNNRKQCTKCAAQGIDCNRTRPQPVRRFRDHSAVPSSKHSIFEYSLPFRYQKSRNSPGGSCWASLLCPTCQVPLLAPMPSRVTTSNSASDIYQDVESESTILSTESIILSNEPPSNQSIQAPTYDLASPDPKDPPYKLIQNSLQISLHLLPPKTPGGSRRCVLMCAACRLLHFTEFNFRPKIWDPGSCTYQEIQSKSTSLSNEPVSNWGTHAPTNNTSPLDPTYPQDSFQEASCLTAHTSRSPGFDTSALSNHPNPHLPFSPTTFPPDQSLSSCPSMNHLPPTVHNGSLLPSKSSYAHYSHGTNHYTMEDEIYHPPIQLDAAEPSPRDSFPTSIQQDTIATSLSGCASLTVPGSWSGSGVYPTPMSHPDFLFCPEVTENFSNPTLDPLNPFTALNMTTGTGLPYSAMYPAVHSMTTYNYDTTI